MSEKSNPEYAPDEAEPWDNRPDAVKDEREGYDAAGLTWPSIGGPGSRVLAVQYPGEDEPRLTGHPPDPNGPDGEFDLTCKCGPDHDDCAVDCQCSCHDAINITLPDGRVLIFETAHDAVLAAHAILSEVEILTRGDI